MVVYRKMLLGAVAVAALVSANPVAAANILYDNLPSSLDNGGGQQLLYASADTASTAFEATDWNLSMTAVENRGYMFGSGQDFVLAALDEPAAIPEPSGWMMLIAGFGAVGRAMRRYRPGRSTVSSI